VVEAEFVLSASRPADFPAAGLPEVAFLGRSNVGKSSLLNKLAGRRKLAFTSGTPGRTRQINFYRSEGRLMLVDLPGYGYAKAARSEARVWKALAEAYLERRGALRLALLLVDARRGWMETDLQLKEWLESRAIPFVVVATKADKLNQKERHVSQQAFREHYPEGELIWFSAVNGQGVKELWQTIWKTMAA
jgi:GTP-binding protein